MAIDLSRVRIEATSKRAVTRRLPRPRPGEKFLKGPIPLSWLAAAARLPGRSLHVAIAIWFTASLAKSATVPLSNLAGLRFGLDRNAKYRALQWLEGADLITVERKLGRSPVVSVLSVSEASESDGQDC